jgi:hypothetical protein
MSERKCWPQVKSAVKARDYEALTYSLILAAEAPLEAGAIPDWVLDLVVELGKLERARLQYHHKEGAADAGGAQPAQPGSPPASVLRLLGDL